MAVAIGNVQLRRAVHEDRPDRQRVRRVPRRAGGPEDRAAERTVMIPDIAMPDVRRLADHGAEGQRSDGRLYGRLINGTGGKARRAGGWPWSSPDRSSASSRCPGPASSTWSSRPS